MKIAAKLPAILLEAANACAGATVMEVQLDQMIGEGKWGIVDTDEKYWQNDSATLVFAFMSECMALTALELPHLVQQSGADEYDYEKVTEADGKESIVVRLWWD